MVLVSILVTPLTWDPVFMAVILSWYDIGVYSGSHYQCNLIFLENMDTNRKPGHEKIPLKPGNKGHP